MMWCILFCRFTSICAGACPCVNHRPSCLVQAPSDWAWCVCHAGVWPHQSDRGPAAASSVPPIACDTQTPGKEKPRRRRQQRRWRRPHTTTFLLPGVRRSGERTARCPGRLPGRCGWWRCGRQVRPVRLFFRSPRPLAVDFVVDLRSAWNCLFSLSSNLPHLHHMCRPKHASAKHCTSINRIHWFISNRFNRVRTIPSSLMYLL